MVKTRASDLESYGSSPTGVRAFFCFTSMPWSSLSSSPSNRKMFHRIFQRGCKAVCPGGRDSINLRLFQALVSHYYSGKPKRVNKQNKKKKKMFNDQADGCLG